MQWPRKGILIRLAIYVPLLAYFGWLACARWRSDRAAAAEAQEVKPTPSVGERLAPHKKTITLPDGTQQDIYELTPEEAEAILGRPMPQPSEAEATPETAPADGKAGPAPDAKPD
jgi:hypothetical protein